MPFLEIKKSEDSADTVIVNIADITSVELTVGAYAHKVVLGIAGGKTEYTWAYETREEAEKTFEKLRGQLGSDIATVFI